MGFTCWESRYFYRISCMNPLLPPPSRGKFGAKQGKERRRTSTSPPPFSLKRTCNGGKKWPVPLNLPFFAVEAYGPRGGGRIRPKKKSRNAFRPVPVPKSTSPGRRRREMMDLNRRNPKGTPKGDGKKSAINCRKLSQSIL